MVIENINQFSLASAIIQIKGLINILYQYLIIGYFLLQYVHETDPESDLGKMWPIVQRPFIPGIKAIVPTILANKITSKYWIPITPSVEISYPQYSQYLPIKLPVKIEFLFTPFVELSYLQYSQYLPIIYWILFTPSVEISYPQYSQYLPIKYWIPITPSVELSYPLY